MSAREGMQSLVDKWRKDADDAPRSQSNEDRGYSNALHDVADELAALLASPAPAFDMDAAVEAASCAVKRWLDWCEENNEAPCERSGATEAITAALPHLMSAAKKEGGEADNLMPDMDALRRERDELRAFAEGFRFTVTDSYYKNAYLTITRPDRSVHYRLSNSSDASDDIADIERRRVAALAQRDTSEGGG